MTNENAVPETVVLVGGGTPAAALAQVLKTFGFGVVTMGHEEARAVFRQNALTIMIFDFDLIPSGAPVQGCPGNRTSYLLNDLGGRSSTKPVQFLRLGRGGSSSPRERWFSIDNLSVPQLVDMFRR